MTSIRRIIRLVLAAISTGTSMFLICAWVVSTEQRINFPFLTPSQQTILALQFYDGHVHLEIYAIDSPLLNLGLDVEDERYRDEPYRIGVASSLFDAEPGAIWIHHLVKATREHRHHNSLSKVEKPWERHGWFWRQRNNHDYLIQLGWYYLWIVWGPSPGPPTPLVPEPVFRLVTQMPIWSAWLLMIGTLNFGTIRASWKKLGTRRQRRAGLCPKCHYDLRAHAPGNKCPECGTVIPSKPAPATTT